MALFMDADAYCAKIMQEIERGFEKNLEFEPPGTYDGRKLSDIALEIYDMVKDIRDPERPESLEELSVLSEECVQVYRIQCTNSLHIVITFVPTVPHCSLASLIGLCLRVKLQRSLPMKFKLDLFVKKGTHNIEDEVNKQINDKERVAAALENPSLQKLVEECLQENS